MSEKLGTNLAEVGTDCISRQAIDKFIDGLEEIFADLRERHVDDSVCGLCEYDGAYIGQSGDWCNECPGFDKDDCFKLSDKTRKEWTEEIIKALPPSQPEQHLDEWCTDCKEYDHEKSCCHRWTKVIRQTRRELQDEFVMTAVDGTLWVTVDDVQKVGRVIVDEEKSKFCRQFYMDAQPEPREDAVSRKDCLQALSHLMDVEGFRDGWAVSRANVECMLKAMLSVMPKQRTGKWIYHIDDLFPAESTQECDQCHSEQPLACDDNYCPNCGVKMMPSNAK